MKAFYDFTIWYILLYYCGEGNLIVQLGLDFCIIGLLLCRDESSFVTRNLSCLHYNYFSFLLLVRYSLIILFVFWTSTPISFSRYISPLDISSKWFKVSLFRLASSFYHLLILYFIVSCWCVFELFSDGWNSLLK